MASDNRLVALVGKQFKTLTVLSRADNKGSHAYWNCKCSCGELVVMRGSHLTKGIGGCSSCRYKGEVLTGKVFGSYTVLKHSASNRNKVLCQCSCGTEQEVFIGNLRKGHSKGCKTCATVVHGMTGTRLYRIWHNMRDRCYNPKHVFYKYYGGCGVEVCQEWRESSQAFISWALKNGYTDTLTISRFGDLGNYEPTNCSWETLEEQGRIRAEKNKLKKAA